MFAIFNISSFITWYFFGRFDEYRRKVQQEMEEEERKEKEKIIAAQRKAARIRALQEEAEERAIREATAHAARSPYSHNGM